MLYGFMPLQDLPRVRQPHMVLGIVMSLKDLPRVRRPHMLLGVMPLKDLPVVR